MEPIKVGVIALSLWKTILAKTLTAKYPFMKEKNTREIAILVDLA